MFLIGLLAITAGTVECAEPPNQWPTRPIRLIVPFAAGGAVDFVARLMAERLSASLGQSVVVDNRAGAAGAIGSNAAAQANGDGYTLLITNITHESNPVLRRNLPYDTLKAFAWVSTIGALTSVLIVPAKSPAASFGDLVSRARHNPGSLNYGSAGIGSINFLAAELMNGNSTSRSRIFHIKEEGRPLPPSCQDRSI